MTEAIELKDMIGVPIERWNVIARIICPDCGKDVHGQGALMQHQNAKHGTKHTRLEIDVVQNKERYGS